MRWIKRLLIAVVAFVAAAIALLFLLPTDRIGQIASDQLKKQTGRTLTLSGDFSPTLYPTLGVKTGRVTISNADWATDPIMVAADGAAVGVNLMALMGGTVEIEKLELISPVINLEKARDGRVNWDLSNASVASGTASPSSSGGTQPSLELGQISNGQVVFKDRAAGTMMNVTAINGTVSLPKGKSLASVDLSAVIDGTAGAIKGTIADLGALTQNTPTPVNGTLVVGGANVTLDGTVALTDGLPRVDGSFQVSASDLTATAETLKIVLPEQAQSLKDLNVAGQMKLNDTTLSLNSTLKAAYAGQAITGTLALSGVGDWMNAPEFNTDVSLDMPQIGQVSYNGRVGQASENTMDGDFSARFSDVRRAMALVGVDPETPKGTFQTGSMKGTLALTPAGKYRLRNATLTLDQNTLTGAISITPREPRPLLLAQLNGKALDFSAYTADSAGGSGNGSVNERTSAGWSKEPIALKGLDAVDADVDLRAQGINLGVSKLGKTDISARVRDGLLTLTLRDVRVFQGAMAGKINLRGGDTVAFDTNIKANGVQLEPLLGQLLDMDRLRGAGNTTLNLKGRGQSLHQIMTSLSGNGAVKFTDGAIKGIDLAAMMRNLKSAFGGFEGATEFSSLDGTFSMEKGVLQNVDLALLSPLFKAAGKGSVDIGGQAMNYVVTPTRLSKDAEFSVPVIITGPWQDLKFRPNLDKLLDLLLDKKLKDSEEAQKIKKKLDAAKAKLKNPEDEIKKKLQEELQRKVQTEDTDTRSLEEQAKDKIEDEIGNALKKLFD